MRNRLYRRDLTSDEHRRLRTTTGTNDARGCIFGDAAMRKRSGFNSKRRFRDNTCSDGDLVALAKRVRYGGNPEHKSDPGDFGLTPPASPKPDKTLCDGAGVNSRDEALALLQRGIEQGMLSEQTRGDFPQNIWAMTDGGTPLEAQLENVEQGSYHGYPVPSSDPFSKEIRKRWDAR